jgi:hypothetical protein
MFTSSLFLDNMTIFYSQALHILIHVSFHHEQVTIPILKEVARDYAGIWAFPSLLELKRVAMLLASFDLNVHKKTSQFFFLRMGAKALPQSIN